MVDFKLNLDYVVRDSDRAEPNGAARRNVTLTEFLISEAVAAKYPPAPPSGGVSKRFGEIQEKTDRRLAGRILNAVARAVKAAGEADVGSVSLTKEQFEFLDKLIEGWAVPAPWAGWWETLSAHCEELKVQALAEKAEKK